MSLPFSFIFIFILVPIIAVITTIINIVQRKKREEHLFRTGINYLKKLRALLTHIQQHRGLNSALLSGNLSLRPEIKQLETLIEKDIAAVSSTNNWINSNTKWEGILDHWGRLASQDSEAEANLKQHNLLIANLLYLIDDLAYAHHLGRWDEAGVMDTDWRNLLSIAEFIGQARALGMAAVTRGYCSGATRVQLNHLCIRIKASLNNHWAESTQKVFDELLWVIAQQVTLEQPTINPEDYFRLASHCIGQVLEEFDRQIDKIQFHRQ